MLINQYFQRTYVTIGTAAVSLTKSKVQNSKSQREKKRSKQLNCMGKTEWDRNNDAVKTKKEQQTMKEENEETAVRWG